MLRRISTLGLPKLISRHSGLLPVALPALPKMHVAAGRRPARNPYLVGKRFLEGPFHEPKTAHVAMPKSAMIRLITGSDNRPFLHPLYPP